MLLTLKSTPTVLTQKQKQKQKQKQLSDCRLYIHIKTDYNVKTKMIDIKKLANITTIEATILKKTEQSHF
jgi:hypothetical protein